MTDDLKARIRALWQRTAEPQPHLSHDTTTHGDISNGVAAPSLHPSEATTTTRCPGDDGDLCEPIDGDISNDDDGTQERDASAASDARRRHHYIPTRDEERSSYNDVAMGRHGMDFSSSSRDIYNDVAIGCADSDAVLHDAGSRFARTDDVIHAAPVDGDMAQVVAQMTTPEQVGAVMNTWMARDDAGADVVSWWRVLEPEARELVARCVGVFGMTAEVQTGVRLMQETRVNERFDDGLHPHDEMTYARIEVWDNGRQAGKRRDLRLKVWWTTASVEQINPTGMFFVRCKLTSPKNILKRLTSHLEPDDDEAHDGVAAIREQVMADNLRLGRGEHHAQLGNLYLKEPGRGTKRWRLQMARLDMMQVEGKERPRVTIYNRSATASIIADCPDNPKGWSPELQRPRWIGYYDPHDYNSYRKRKDKQ